jgi:hypothetical protein
MEFQDYWDKQIDRLESTKDIGSAGMNFLFTECFKAWNAAQESNITLDQVMDKLNDIQMGVQHIFIPDSTTYTYSGGFDLTCNCGHCYSCIRRYQFGE